MNTTENNRLIAVFMGWELKHNPNISQKTWNNKEKGYCRDKESTFFEYSKDWNWLMEVVEKIESLHESNNVLIGTNITYVQIHNKVRNEQETFKGVSNIKIESVYNACVEFIKWYNEQKNQL